MRNLSDSTTAVLLAARHHAAARRCGCADLHDIFVALVADPRSSPSRILIELGIDHARLLTSFGNRMKTHWSPLPRGKGPLAVEQLPFTPAATHIFYKAESVSGNFDADVIEPEHLLVAVLQHPAGMAFMHQLGLTTAKVRFQVGKSREPLVPVAKPARRR